MKVNLSLIPANSVPPRQTGDASEARRAFEAMLSASAARTRAEVAPIEITPVTASIQRPATRIEAELPTQLSRPGRVLDIKV